MYHVGLLLTCVCAVYSHSHHRRRYHHISERYPPTHVKAPAPLSLLNSELEDSNNTPPRPQHPQNVYDLYEHQSHQSPIDSWESEDESSESAENETLGQIPDNIVETLQHPPAPWIPHLYNKSLQNLDEGLAKLKVHLKSYDTNYHNLIKKYMNEAMINPRNVAFVLQCAVLHPLERAIRRVREVIQHPAVRFVCEAQPSSCDAAIWTLLRTASPDTIQASEVLLAAGNAAPTYLNSFASAFEAISGQNVYKYLMSAKEELRSLVAADAYARQIINANGEPHCTPLLSPSALSYSLQK